jgi:hypothetical protein
MELPTMAETPDGLTDQLIEQASRLSASTLERRGAKRHAYDGRVAIVLLSETGSPSAPVILQGRNISAGGLCVISRQMIHPGTVGAVQMVRSDGSAALVGATVRYCVYVGNMRHFTGVEFMPLPSEITAADFVDQDGRAINL